MAAPDPKPAKAKRRKPKGDRQELQVSREVVFARAENECEVKLPHCDTRGPLQVHHRQLRRGGNDRPSNLLAVCLRCHSGVHANPWTAYSKGWLVKQHEEPAEIPVFYRAWVQVMLTDDGATEAIA